MPCGLADIRDLPLRLWPRRTPARRANTDHLAGLTEELPSGTTDFLYSGVQCVDQQDGSDTNSHGNTICFSAAGTAGNWFASNATKTTDPKCTFIFTGRRYDPETLIYFYRARYYHPELGRFVSRDPIGYPSGLGLYSYVGTRPTRFRDPEGLWRFCNEDDEKWLKDRMPECRTGTIWGTQRLAEHWGIRYQYGYGGGSARFFRGVIYLPFKKREEDQPWDKWLNYVKASDIVHETVEAVVGSKIMGVSGSSLGCTGEPDRNLRNPVTDPEGRIEGYVPVWASVASGTHNLALIYEIAAIASRYSEKCTCDWAREEFETGHVHSPKHEPLPFQKDLASLVQFICDCEHGNASGKRHPIYHCISNESWWDREIAEMRADLKCEGRRVRGTFNIKLYD